MSVIIPEKELPQQLSLDQAVELAYASEMAEVASKLQRGLPTYAREVIPLLYETPELVWLGFKDPSFPVPRVIENLFPHHVSILGIARSRLRYLITQGESRKFGTQLTPW